MKPNHIAALFVFFTMFLIGADWTVNHNASAKSASALEGTWHSSDPDMTAQVSGNAIEIKFTNDDLDALYWKGTLPAQAASGMPVTSVADLKVMDKAPLSSQDSTKQFVLKDSTLQFSFSILGTTRTVVLKKS